MSQAKRTNKNADHTEAEEEEGATVAAADTAETDAEEAEVTEDVTDAAAVDIETATGTKTSAKIS